MVLIFWQFQQLLSNVKLCVDIPIPNPVTWRTVGIWDDMLGLES